METALQVVVGVTAVPLLALGARSMFKPRGMEAPFSLTPRGAAGLSTIRSVAGGLFFACASMLGLGLSTGETLWFLAVAIVMGAVAVGRVVGIVSDGLDKAVIPPLLVEVAIGGTLVVAHFIARAS